MGSVCQYGRVCRYRLKDHPRDSLPAGQEYSFPEQEAPAHQSMMIIQIAQAAEKLEYATHEVEVRNGPPQGCEVDGAVRSDHSTLEYGASQTARCRTYRFFDAAISLQATDWGSITIPTYLNLAA